jgi:hypothetical protein
MHIFFNEIRQFSNQLYTCVCIYIYIYTLYVYTYMNTYTYSSVYVCMYSYREIFMHILRKSDNSATNSTPVGPAPITTQCNNRSISIWSLLYFSISSSFFTSDISNTPALIFLSFSLFLLLKIELAAYQSMENT